MTGADQKIDRDEIARRAYAIAQNGHANQSDEDNWLQAENEIRAEKAEQTRSKKPRTRNAPPNDDAVPEAD